MELEEDYKRTDVGVIPQDWEVKPQKEIVKYINGRAYGLHEWEKNGVPVVRLQNLTNKGGNFYYSKLKLPDYQYMYKGDLIFMWSASFGPFIWWGNKAIFHYHIWKIECNKEKAFKDFYYYKLVEITEELKKGTSGSTMLHLTKGFMENYKISVPPLSEQKAISQVLSDTDSLLQTLEQKLAKKRAIKQGAMQHLLTPKEGWEVRMLGEISLISGAGIDKKIRENEEPVLLLNYMDVFKRNYLFNNELYHWVTAPKSKTVSCNIKKGDIFLTPSSELRTDIGVSALAMEDMEGGVYSYHIDRLRYIIEIDMKFGLYILKTRRFLEQCETMCEGSGKRYVISMGKFRNMEVALPKDIKVQNQIATILSDMDAEIGQLEQKLEKYKLLKQGLMQELLTGRIRLV